jgi:hypothetical protein
MVLTPCHTAWYKIAGGWMMNGFFLVLFFFFLLFWGPALFEMALLRLRYEYRRYYGV